MRKITILTFTTILSIFTFISCKHDPTPPIIVQSTVPTGICFQDEILPIIQSNCAYSGCHAGSQNPDLSTYNGIMKLVKVGDPQNSSLYKYAIGNKMPPSPKTLLNLDDVTFIYGWIQQGALDNSCACDTTVFTFSGAVSPIIRRNCLGCHGATSANPLTTFQQISDKADQILLDITYQYNPMPKPPTAKLSDCKITQIWKWIDSGKPNN